MSLGVRSDFAGRELSFLWPQVLRIMPSFQNKLLLKGQSKAKYIIYPCLPKGNKCVF